METVFYSKTSYLILLYPEDLCIDYELHEPYKEKLNTILFQFQKVLAQRNSLEKVDFINTELAALNSSPYFLANTKHYDFSEYKNFKEGHTYEYDDYFNSRHLRVQFPAEQLLFNLITVYKIYLEFTLYKTQTSDALSVWKRFHWFFFVFIQGLIISILRFEKEINSGNIHQADIELGVSADLMLGAGLGMNLAGSFSNNEYQTEVRPTMSPPNVKSKDFSGLMSLDHSYLINLWKRNRKSFKELSTPLRPDYIKFISAYEFLAASHKSVCQKFGGNDAGSLNNKGSPALDSLDKVIKLRRHLIDPSANELDSKYPYQREENETLMNTAFASYLNLLSMVFRVSLPEVY